MPEFYPDEAQVQVGAVGRFQAAVERVELACQKPRERLAEGPRIAHF